MFEDGDASWWAQFGCTLTPSGHIKQHQWQTMVLGTVTPLILTVALVALGSGAPLTGRVRGNVSEPVPVVLWHGMGDTCCNPLSMGYIKRQVQQQIPGVYVDSLMIGLTVANDLINGYTMNANEQVEKACHKIRKNSKLQNGYHAMGFSQGGQFLRAVAQRCPDPPMFNLVTWGGQHQGVFGLPGCPANVPTCDQSRDSTTVTCYTPDIQIWETQCEYWHDSSKPDWYRKSSVFIADINQENAFNETYKQNLLKLWNLVMIKFTEDTTVIPRESEWFGFYNEGQAQETSPLENNTALWEEDRLGLRQLYETGRLARLPVKGDHLQIPHDDLIAVIDRYLKQQQPNNNTIPVPFPWG